jgi:hypothetical protein
MSSNTGKRVYLSDLTTPTIALNQVCRIVYGKSFKDVVGNPAVVVVKSDTTLVITLPGNARKPAAQGGWADSWVAHGYDMGKKSPAMKLLNNIVEHARNKGRIIEIEYSAPNA